MKRCVAWTASLLQRGPTLRSVAITPPGPGFRDHSPKPQNPLKISQSCFLPCVDFGTPTSPITELKIILFMWVLPRTEHTWEEDAEMEEEMKAVSEGFSHSMPVWLVWANQQERVGCCLFSCFAWKMGFPCAPHSIYQFPVGKSILVTRHKRTYCRTVFVLGRVTGAHHSGSGDRACPLCCITWFHTGRRVPSGSVFKELWSGVALL